MALFRIKRYAGEVVFLLSMNLFSSGLWAQENTTDAVTTPKTYALSLDDVSHLVLKNNFEIQLAQYDARITKTQKGVAESIYDTVINAEVKYKNNQLKRTSTLTGTKVIDNDYNIGLSKKIPVGTKLTANMDNNRHWANSPFVTLSPSHDSSLGLTVEQELGRNFLGIQDRGGIKITKIDIENSGFSSLDKIEDVLSQAQKAYWDLVLALEFVKIEEGIVRQAQKLYLLHQEKLKDGLVELPEALASEANYKDRLNELLVAENSAKTKANVLKLLLNITDEASMVLPTQQFALPEGREEVDKSLALAFSNRRDYKSAFNEIHAKDIKLSMSRNNLWPEIDLTASFKRNGIGDHFKQAIEQINQEDNPELFAGIVFNFPIENTKAKSELERAQFEKAKAILTVKLLERKIMVNVMDQVRTYNVLLERAHNYQYIAKLQEQKLSEEQKRFNYGRSSTDTIIRYQEDLLKAKWQAAQAASDVESALIDLWKNEGTLLHPYWEGAI